MDNSFAKEFWEFIKKGGYKARQWSDGKPEFYRFIEPTDPNYPMMIELFAGRDSKQMMDQGHLIPLHVDDDISSLSAILLNESYYGFLLDGITEVDGVSVLDAEHLVPLKMKAWLDLTERKTQGKHVNERDLRKHRQDVFRLYDLISDDEKIKAPEEVYMDIKLFTDMIRGQDFDPRFIGLSQDKDHVLDVYRRIYRTEE